MTFDEFPQNKYTIWYINLIQTRQLQEKIKFKTEAHHIFPISIFGKNNLTVNLTIREHFLAHMILARLYEKSVMTKEYSMMSHAFDFMSDARIDNKGRKIKINSILFEKYKKESAKSHSEKFTKFWSNQENRDEQSKRRKEHLSAPENYDKMCKVNKKLSNTPEGRKQRSEKQKELSSNPEYTKLRIDAMTTPEAVAKSKVTIKEQIETMTPEERKRRFSHPQNEEQRKANSEQAKGRKRLINKERNKLRSVKGEVLESLILEGWTYWNDLSKEEKSLYKTNI